MKKFIAKTITLLALGSGVLFYTANCTSYNRINDIARIAKRVVLQNEDYSKVLISEVEPKNEYADWMVERAMGIKKERLKHFRPAKGFVREPYDLRVSIENSEQGYKTFIRDLNSGKKLPISEELYVGDLEHRLKGTSAGAKEKITEAVDSAKQFANSIIEDYLK